MRRLTDGVRSSAMIDNWQSSPRLPDRGRIGTVGGKAVCAEGLEAHRPANLFGDGTDFTGLKGCIDEPSSDYRGMSCVAPRLKRLSQLNFTRAIEYSLRPA